MSRAQVLVEHKESDKENEELQPMAEADANAIANGSESQSLARQNSQQAHQHAHAHHNQHAHDLVIHDHEREESVPPTRHHSRTSPPLSLPHSPRYSIFTCTTPRRSRTTSRTQLSQQASLTNSYEHPTNGSANGNGNGANAVELVVEGEREDGTVSMSVPVSPQTQAQARGEQESELSRLLRTIAERRKHESTATASSGTGSRRHTSCVWTRGSEDDGALDEWLGPSAMERINVPQRGSERYKLAGVKLECVPIVDSIAEDPDMKAIVDYFEGSLFSITRTITANI